MSKKAYSQCFGNINACANAEINAGSPNGVLEFIA